MTTPPDAHDAARPLAVTLSLHQDLFDRYGPLAGGRELCRLLGFPTLGAFQQAWRRKPLPVPVFTIAHRRGGYALTADISAWLVALRGAADTERRTPMT